MTEAPLQMSTAEALKKSSVARYIQLASLFRQRVETGEWAIGNQIPTVETLAKDCGVATMTIRQALDILEAEGLIERFRAKGTFVKEHPRADLWCKVNTDWNGMLLARKDAEIAILWDRREVSLPPHSAGGGVQAPAYRHLRRRHSRNGIPFLLADVFLDERICPLIDESAYLRMTAMRLVSDLPDHRITDARQEVTIGSADLEVSTQLNMRLGDPIAKVQRTAIDEHNQLVLVANGIYRGDMTKIEIKLR